jgi:hypothetical protein
LFQDTKKANSFAWAMIYKPRAEVYFGFEGTVFQQNGRKDCQKLLRDGYIFILLRPFGAKHPSPERA